jgi:hypothetical protein
LDAFGGVQGPVVGTAVGIADPPLRALQPALQILEKEKQKHLKGKQRAARSIG